MTNGPNSMARGQKISKLLKLFKPLMRNSLDQIVQFRHREVDTRYSFFATIPPATPFSFYVSTRPCKFFSFFHGIVSRRAIEIAVK